MPSQRVIKLEGFPHYSFVRCLGLAFTAFGVEKRSKSYKLTAYTSDNIHYKPLPLENFRSIELSVESGARSSANISQRPPCCFGLCGWFGVRKISFLFSSVLYRSSEKKVLNLRTFVQLKYSFGIV